MTEWEWGWTVEDQDPESGVKDVRAKLAGYVERWPAMEFTCYWCTVFDADRPTAGRIEISYRFRPGTPQLQSVDVLGLIEMSLALVWPTKRAVRPEWAGRMEELVKS